MEFLYDLAVYGLILIVFSILFWWKYGFPGAIVPFPPITSLVVIVSVIGMGVLFWFSEVRINIFGSGEGVRDLLIGILGTIFIGFILMITILWSLKVPANKKHLDIYFQSLLLVMLFFFFVISFYYLLAAL